jgi:hypothetical protein
MQGMNNARLRRAWRTGIVRRCSGPRDLMKPTLRKHGNTQKPKRLNLAGKLLGKTQEGQSIEDDLFAFFTLLSDAASKRPLVTT